MVSVDSVEYATEEGVDGEDSVAAADEVPMVEVVYHGEVEVDDPEHPVNTVTVDAQLSPQTVT